MPYVNDREYESFINYRKALLDGLILTHNGICNVCKKYANNPAEIGNHFLRLTEKGNKK